jgi:hypothetical protein
MTSARPSLLSYHCNDALVMMGQLPIATVTYGSLLQCLFVVVMGFLPCGTLALKKLRHRH